MNVLGDECLGDDCRTIGQFGTGQFVCGAKLFWYHLKNSLSNDLKSLNVFFFRKKCNPRLETVRHLILENSIQRGFQNFKMCSIMHSKLKTSQSLPDGLASDPQCTHTNFLWGESFKRKTVHNKLLKVLRAGCVQFFINIYGVLVNYYFQKI